MYSRNSFYLAEEKKMLFWTRRSRNGGVGGEYFISWLLYCTYIYFCCSPWGTHYVCRVRGGS